MLSNDFNYMINQFGVDVILNDESKTRKALLSSRGLRDLEVNFDDRVIHTNFKIKRGDTITYNDVIYLVYSDVQAKRGHEYKAVIRPMTNRFTFTYTTEGYFEETDRMGNPIWIIPPEEVTEDLPCIAYQEGSPTIVGSWIRLPEERVKVILPDNYITQQIKRNTDHQLYNRYYKIVDINLLQSGLRILTMEWTTPPTSN